MRYRVHVPAELPLKFPDQCPFTGMVSPTGSVRLRAFSTSTVLPIPGGFLNSYSKSTLRLPAARKIALTVLASELMIWISLLGGIALCGWCITYGSDAAQRFAFVFVVGGVLAALAFRIFRACVLRGVRIKPPWNGFVEILFKSETFAKAFAEQNRLPISVD